MWLALIAAFVAALAFYAWWTARRLDRLHVRLDLAATALDAQLRQRAFSTERLAAFLELRGRPEGPALASATAATRSVIGLGSEREQAESALGGQIRTAALVADGNGRDGETAQLHEVADQVIRAAFARRFYNDAVRDVLVVRDRRVVRWLHLAGRAPLPAYVELDDPVLETVPALPVARGR